MNYLFLDRSRRNLAASALVVFAVAASACSGTNSGASPLSNRASAERTTYNYNFTTVSAGTDTAQVLGIDHNADIVGVYQSSNSTYSFTSQPPYSRVSQTNYPDASNGTVLRSIAIPVGNYGSAGSGTVEAGYAIRPGGGAGNSEHGTYPAVDNAGLWSLVGLYQVTGTLHDCQNNQLWGINDSGEAVGFREVYQKGTKTSNFTCLIKAYKVLPGANPSNIDLPGGTAAVQSSQATGIDKNGDWVGFFSGAGTGSSQCGAVFCGWYHLKGTSNGYYSFSDGGGSTYALGINDNKYAVGVYNDGHGSEKGFLYNINTRSFQNINPGVQWTNWGVTGINDSGVICGWYGKAGSGAATYGFVGTPQSQRAQR